MKEEPSVRLHDKKTLNFDSLKAGEVFFVM